MSSVDKKGLCLAYALERAGQITGRRVNGSVLLGLAVETISGGRVPDTAPGVRRIEVDDVGEAGDIVVMRGGSGLHALVSVGSGIVEDVDPRGRRRRVPFRRVAWLTHSCWRLVG